MHYSLLLPAVTFHLCHYLRQENPQYSFTYNNNNLNICYKSVVQPVRQPVSVGTESLFLRHPNSLSGGSELDPCPVVWSYLTLRSDSAAPQSHFSTIPTCNLKVCKSNIICLVCFLFSVLLSSLSGPVSHLSHPPFYFVGEKERRRRSREMMKFQGKVEVPSITGGGKVQINHLISPAFSPLS